MQLVEQGEAAQRVGAAEQLPQLGQLALAGGLGGAGGAPRGRARRCAGSIFRSARRRAGRRAAAAAGPPRSSPGRPRGGRRARGRRGRSKGSIASPPASGTATAPTVKSRAARSASIAVAAEHGRRRPASRAPGRRRARCRTRRRARRRARRARGRAPWRRRRVAGDGEVEVGDLAAERRVADGAAGDPGPLPAERPIAATGGGAAITGRLNRRGVLRMRDALQLMRGAGAPGRRSRR